MNIWMLEFPSGGSINSFIVFQFNVLLVVPDLKMELTLGGIKSRCI